MFYVQFLFFVPGSKWRNTLYIMASCIRALLILLHSKCEHWTGRLMIIVYASSGKVLSVAKPHIDEVSFIIPFHNLTDHDFPYLQ